MDQVEYPQPHHGNIVPDCPDPAQIVDKNNKTKWCNPTPDSWSRQYSYLTTGTDRQLQT